jgi:hypothetical protein
MAWHGEPGRQLYYEDYGNGDAVVLMPGWGGNIVEFGPLRHSSRPCRSSRGVRHGWAATRSS